MNKCYLDSNILIYFKNEESIFFTQSKKIITSLIENDFLLFISPLILDEFLHGIKVQMLIKKIKQNLIFHLLSTSLKEILGLPSLNIINPPNNPTAQLQVVTYMEQFNLRPRDAYHLLTMQAHSINYFVTIDKDFRKVFNQKVILPYSS